MNHRFLFLHSFFHVSFLQLYNITLLYSNTSKIVYYIFKYSIFIYKSITIFRCYLVVKIQVENAFIDYADYIFHMLAIV